MRSLSVTERWGLQGGDIESFYPFSEGSAIRAITDASPTRERLFLTGPGVGLFSPLLYLRRGNWFVRFCVLPNSADGYSETYTGSSRTSLSDDDTPVVEKGCADFPIDVSNEACIFGGCSYYE